MTYSIGVCRYWNWMHRLRQSRRWADDYLEKTRVRVSLVWNIGKKDDNCSMKLQLSSCWYNKRPFHGWNSCCLLMPEWLGYELFWIGEVREGVKCVKSYRKDRHYHVLVVNLVSSILYTGPVSRDSGGSIILEEAWTIHDLLFQIRFVSTNPF